jgi:hypothetical protein
MFNVRTPEEIGLQPTRWRQKPLNMVSRVWPPTPKLAARTSRDALQQHEPSTTVVTVTLQRTLSTNVLQCTRGRAYSPEDYHLLAYDVVM